MEIAGILFFVPQAEHLIFTVFFFIICSPFPVTSGHDTVFL